MSARACNGQTGSEYRALLADCHVAYCESRLGLVAPIAQARAAGLSKRPLLSGSTRAGFLSHALPPLTGALSMSDLDRITSPILWRDCLFRRPLASAAHTCFRSRIILGGFGQFYFASFAVAMPAFSLNVLN